MDEAKRKELRYLAEYIGDAWEPDACLIGNMKAAKIALVGEAVPSLLDALDEAERKQKIAENLFGHARKSFDALQSENAALRERLAKIEKAARLICLDIKLMDDTEDPHVFDAAEERYRETVSALRAALEDNNG